MILAQQQWPCDEGGGRVAPQGLDVTPRRFGAGPGIGPIALPGAAATIAGMPHVAFTSQLKRFTETPEFHTGAATLREALEAAFDINPRLRHYVLDEQGHLRQHVVVFIGARRAVDRVGLTDALAPDDQVHVLQALTGG